MTALLSFENVSKSFGALRVTDDLSFEVRKGEALGVLGPNGAGKTTVFNLITGGLAPDAGRIRFNGQDIVRLSPHRRCRAGIGRSYQVALPFEGMTVFENLLVGAMFGAGKRSALRGEQSLCRSSRSHRAPRQSQPPRRILDPARP